MSGRSVSVVQGMVLSAAALLLMAPQVLGGGSVRAGKGTISPSQPVSAPTRMAPAAATLSIIVTLAPPPTTPPLSVNLRGPDGQVRRFAVEGGRDVIQTRSVVLRPGESLTISWRPTK